MHRKRLQVFDISLNQSHLFCQLTRAIVDDYQQSWDGLRRQIRAVLWEEAVRQTGVPQYLGAPDDLKLLLMKAQNRKAGSHAYRVHDRSRLSFQGHWYKPRHGFLYIYAECSRLYPHHLAKRVR